MVNKSTENKESKSLKISSATLVGGNTDGKNLYLIVELFDGEHNNRFEPVFPMGTSAEDVTEYLKGIIEDDPKFPDDITGLMQKTVFWDNEEQDWYTRVGNQKPIRIDLKHKDKDKDSSVHTTHTTHKK